MFIPSFYWLQFLSVNEYLKIKILVETEIYNFIQKFYYLLSLEEIR